MDFAAIDWQRPWLQPVREIGQALASAPDWMQAANTLARKNDLSNAAGLSITFTPQHLLPELASYEAHIHATGEVPTRDNLHDFFNALMWLRFPRVKRTLNQLQALEIGRSNQQPTASGTRGIQRDAATLFDENAALFISSDPSLIAALKQHHWKSVLLKDPAKFAADCKVILFGHALLEKLVSPYKAITAHVWCIEASADWFELSPGQQVPWLDERLVPIMARGFASADFSHLPVLGVPGWWPEQNDDFYSDASVFRPLKPNRAR